ncbi:phosphoribosylamine--glycine ligase [Tepidibacillus fermentans]|uniref:Phosphoribosylamine--glycine ligase n=1 Tax=Tepidibacillus fermentans TaxID=1281767 RepID=A0A4R3KCG6_9BACI|nr:phosphoribosylamine--glycine ligase [Tepidibacillus fermentans]TCS80609.1 phosphoribosylamine--glycine ligase [Tepidibacillus fermentans]
MKVLVVGQGGREHALVKAIKRSKKVERIYCAPGNGGIEQDAICLPIQEDDFPRLVEAVQQYQIDLTVVGPENPLHAGIVDYFQERGLPIIGPSKVAARIEASKSFAKKLMAKYNIPTADYQVFDHAEAAIEYVKEKGAPIVIKADGLAAGKGVVVANTVDEAIIAIQNMMEQQIFGTAGQKIVIEEFLEGEELTVMSFVDGEHFIMMEPAQDHKPIFDGDKGPNTGGMGSYSPVPQMGQELLHRVREQIIKPIIAGMANEGYPFKGILYAGLMMTKSGPKVIEFNARFGDPETQVILPRLKTDLIDIFTAIQNGTLDQLQLEWDQQAAVCVIMSSKGYPGDYEKGKPIKINETLLPKQTEIYLAGVRREQGHLLTNGGRVLGVTALGTTIQEAKERAYQGVQAISFEGAHYRTDIANKAIYK